MDVKTRARAILRRLKKHYTVTANDFLFWSTPLELVVATMLSAQCTDKRVNLVTPHLFKKYKTAADYARAKLATLEKEIRSTGFYHNKAKNLKGIGRVLIEKFNGKVPKRMDDLIQLPGVARKTANLILARAFKHNVGIAVDTHVTRLAGRMGLSKHTAQERIEHDLNGLYAPSSYLNVNELFILHGRSVCKAPKPKCPECPVGDLCQSREKFMRQYYNKPGASVGKQSKR